MIVHLEYLFHYSCDHCKGFWAIADRPPVIGTAIVCPDPACGKSSIIEEVKRHQLDMIGVDEEYSTIESIEDLNGWFVLVNERYKEGVRRLQAVRLMASGKEYKVFYCAEEILKTWAIADSPLEQESKP